MLVVVPLPFLHSLAPGDSSLSRGLPLAQSGCAVAAGLGCCWVFHLGRVDVPLFPRSQHPNPPDPSFGAQGFERYSSFALDHLLGFPDRHFPLRSYYLHRQVLSCFRLEVDLYGHSGEERADAVLVQPLMSTLLSNEEVCILWVHHQFDHLSRSLAKCSKYFCQVLLGFWCIAFLVLGHIISSQFVYNIQLYPCAALLFGCGFAYG